MILHKHAGQFIGGLLLLRFLTHLKIGDLVKNYFPMSKDIKEVPNLAVYYGWFSFRKRSNTLRPSEVVRHNFLQKITYVVMMFLAMSVVIFTGILFCKIMSFYGTIWFIGGLPALSAFYVVEGYIFVLYLIIPMFTCLS